jgi:hypothetical protein
LKRTNDASALKRMYRAKKPVEVGQLESELHIDGAMEVDELDSDDGAAGPSAGGRAKRGQHAGEEEEAISSNESSDDEQGGFNDPTRFRPGSKR